MPVAYLIRFKTKSGQEQEFINAWEEVTQIIYNHSGSLGSRLHKVDDGHYLAYAYWPNAMLRDTGAEKLPKAIDEPRQRMNEACTSIDLIEQMDVISDLIKTSPKQI